MVLDMESQTLESKRLGCKLPLVFKYGHLYYEWISDFLFTAMKIHRMDKRFYHPEAERLHAVIKRSDPSKEFPDLLKDIKSINATCDSCQRMAQGPHLFEVALPFGTIIFNATGTWTLRNLK